MGWQTRVRATRVSGQPSVQRRRPSARSTSQVARFATAIRSSSTPSPWCCGSGRFTEDAGICLGLQAACQAHRVHRARTGSQIEMSAATVARVNDRHKIGSALRPNVAGSSASSHSVIGHRVRCAPDPPFGTPRTMTVRLVADIQNRLFWRVGNGRASECCVPLCGPRARHPEMGSDVRAEQRLQGLSLCVAPDRVVLIAATSPSQQKGQVSGSNQRRVRRRRFTDPRP